MSQQIKQCKDCKPPIKTKSFGDYDMYGNQFYWCMKAKRYVTDKHIAENCTHPFRPKEEINGENE